MLSQVLSCPRHGDQRLPTRVIDVGSSDKSPSLMVSKGLFGKWVALSHCWGRRLPNKTELGNLKDRCDGISMAELAPNFQDAVLITRELGIKYLF
jgi:hypothetical protein